tara:strand:+ start:15459 stop:15587 length:129 start_codon:yes stop_codon:yes gene_type:complete
MIHDQNILRDRVIREGYFVPANDLLSYSLTKVVEFLSWEITK